MAKKKFEPNSEYRVDFNQYATDKILRVFESENLNPLAMEWLSIRPYNVNKGTDYNRVNRLIMSLESAIICDPRYCPKGQVRDIGANNKGLNYDMRIKSGKTSFCAYNVQNLNLPSLLTKRQHFFKTNITPTNSLCSNVIQKNPFLLH